MELVKKLNKALKKQDKELVLEVFEEIYDYYKPLVIFVCSKYLSKHEEIEDAIQETFLNFFNNIAEAKDIKTYLTYIAKNTAIKISKQEKYVTFDDMDSFSSDVQNAFVDLKIILDDLENYLSKEEIRIIVLHLIDGKTFKEISSLDKTNDKTVKSTYYRALDKYKKKIGVSK